MEDNDSLQTISSHLQPHLIILGAFITAMWGLEIIDWILGGYLDQFGIVPRQLIGLRGILAAPLLHGDFAHVAANTFPFIILGWFVLLRGVKAFTYVVMLALIISGLGTWIIAPASSIHIGASGLVFGFFGYLLMRGYFERSWQSIAWSLIVLLLYGGMLVSLLPTTLGVSWQMHLFGFIGGGFAAYLLSGRDQSLSRSPGSEI